jgi:hypothetical protein
MMFNIREALHNGSVSRLVAMQRDGFADAHGSSFRLAACDSICYSAHVSRPEAAMAELKSIPIPKPARRPSGKAALAHGARAPATPVHASVLEEAARAGLLAGEKSEHVSFRAPPALVEAAKRETGITSTSELGVLALAMLAQPDPVVEYMKRTSGALGKDHTLEY